MEWNGMKDNLLYFHANSKLDFVHGIYKKYMRIYIRSIRVFYR